MVAKKTNERRNNGEFKQWMGSKAVFGHLHEFRQIPNSNPPAYSVRISVPQGRNENVRYAALELVVDSLPAFQLLNQLADKINDDAVKSTLTFNFYGAHPKAYVLKEADGTPKVNEEGDLELRAFIAGRLSHISYLKVDDVVIHRTNKADNDEQSESSNNDDSETNQSNHAEAGKTVDAGVADGVQADPDKVSEKVSKKSVRKATA